MHSYKTLSSYSLEQITDHNITSSILMVVFQVNTTYLVTSWPSSATCVVGNDTAHL